VDQDGSCAAAAAEASGRSLRRAKPTWPAVEEAHSGEQHPKGSLGHNRCGMWAWVDEALAEVENPGCDVAHVGEA
jgi:hypothetical protein